MIEDDFVDGEVINIVGELTEDRLANIYWKTREGKSIRISDMEDKHLRNTALFLMGIGYSYCVAPEPVRIAWLAILRMEWERRQIASQNGNKRFRSYPTHRNLIND